MWFRIVIATAALTLIAGTAPAGSAVPPPSAAPPRSIAASSDQAGWWVASGQVFREGKPVRKATIRLRTVSGKKIAIVGGKRKTDKWGHFRVWAKQLPSTFQVTAKGGSVGQHKQKTVTMLAYSRRNDPATFVNLTTTLVVKYHQTHPKKSVKKSARNVGKYLRLPSLSNRPVMRVGQFAHVPSKAHDPRRFDARARKHGGVDNFLTRLAGRIQPGQHPKSLKPRRMRAASFGKGLSPFPGAESRRSSALSATVTSDSLDPLTMLSSTLSSGMTWMLQNGAQGAACAVSSNHNILSGLFGCNSTANQAAQISSTLATMQTELTNLQSSVDTLNDEFLDAASAAAISASGITKLSNDLSDIHAYGVALQSGSAGTPSKKLGKNGGPWSNPPSDIDRVCQVAFPSSITANTSNTLNGQSPQGACEGLGDYYGATSNNQAPLAQTQLTALFNNLTGYDTTEKTNLLIPTVQQSLSNGGTTMIQGADQNGFNQQLADIVGGQVALMQWGLAYYSWYETWTTPTLAVHVCAVGTYMDAFPVSSITTNWGDSCGLAIYAWTQLSVEWNIAGNGARGALPSMGNPGTTAAASDIGVVIDTVGNTTSPTVWWAPSVDISGLTLNNGSDWWPYVEYGMQPGQTSGDSSGPDPYVNPVFYPTTPEQLMTDYPDTFLLGDWISTGQLAQHASAAEPTASSIGDAMNDLGFPAPGQGAAGMMWEYLASAPNTFTFQTQAAYPGFQIDGKWGSCGSWPASIITYPNSGTPAITVATGYSCSGNGTANVNNYLTVTGTWSDGKYVDMTVGSTNDANWQVSCPTGPTQGLWGTQATTGNQVPGLPSNQNNGYATFCGGPGQTGGAQSSFFGQMYDTNPGTVLWNRSLVTGWSSQTCIPSLDLNSPSATPVSASSCTRSTPTPSPSTS